MSGTFPAVHTLHLHRAVTLKIREKQDMGDRRLSLELQVFSLAI